MPCNRYSVVLASLLGFTGCDQAQVLLSEREAISVEAMTGPEALEWLKNNSGESCLASNRFGETPHATQFVKSLYQAGATRVIVPDDCIRTDEAESYSDALVVHLPPDAAQQQLVRNLCDRELRRAGHPQSTPAETAIFLGWD